MPHDLIETGNGLLFMASGFDPVLKWDGVRTQAETAGVKPPLTAVTMAVSNDSADPAVNSSKYWTDFTNLNQWLTEYQSLASEIAQKQFANDTPAGVPPGFTIREYLEHLMGQYQEAKAREAAAHGPTQLVGPYIAYTRFVDRDGNYSNFSPPSAELKIAGGSIKTLNTFVAPYKVNAPAHGLSTGNKVIIKVYGGSFVFGKNVGSLVQGGLTDIADVTSPVLWTITKVDADNFTLDNSSTNSITFTSGTPEFQTASSQGGQGGTFTFGMYLQESDKVTWESAAYAILYTNVPVPAEGKVLRRQILRNTSGQYRGWYVDIDTEDLTSTTFKSYNNDIQLAASQFVPLIDPDGIFLGFNRSIPPDNKKSFASGGGRVFAAVNAVYTEGSVSVTFGSATVTGIGTEWKECFKNRWLHIVGDKGYEILSCSESAQTLTLVEAYLGTTDAYANYAIRAHDDRSIYYSEAGLPEAWDPYGAFSVPVDNDEMTGLLWQGSFLYILESKRLYRFTFRVNPGLDGDVYPSANRGCVNDRCAVVVDNDAYMIDRSGIYIFSGGDVRPISMAIRDLFSTYPGMYRINWAFAANFHGVHYQPQETVFFFVSLDGNRIPKHAIAYNYRSEAFSLIEFATPIGSSDVAVINGHEYLILGTSGKRVIAYPVGSLDGPDHTAGTVRGSVASVTWTSLTDATATFGSDLVGNPVSITAGRGKGQVRIVSSVSGTRINVTQPWAILPDATSSYQLGGMSWHWKSGLFWFVEDENQNPRRVAVAFNPTVSPASMDMRLYMDRKAVPEAMARDYNSEDGSGVASVKDSPDLTVDLTRALGYVEKQLDRGREMHAPGNRIMALELRGVQSQDEVRIHEIVIDGAK